MQITLSEAAQNLNPRGKTARRAARKVIREIVKARSRKKIKNTATRPA